MHWRGSRVGSFLLLMGLTQVALPAASTAGADPAASGAKPSGQSSMFMNGPMHPGRSPFQGPQTNHLAWFIPTQTGYGGPVIGGDGTIYQGTDFNQLLAISPDGITKWAILTSRAVESTPAILPDGRIVVVDEAGTVYVANPDGTLSWTYVTGAGVGTSPAIGRDGTVYLTAGATVYALHPDGSVRWTYELGGTASEAVSVRPDGVVYATTSRLYAIDPEGFLLWMTDSMSLKSSSIGPDGTIYVHSATPTVYAFRPNGTVKWSYSVGTCCVASEPPPPAIGRDGTIYAAMTLADGGGGIFALNPDGTLKWEAPYGHAVTAPVVDRDGSIYYGGGSGAPSVFALNPDGTLKWQFDTPDGYVRTPVAVGRHHRLYAGGSGGIYAVGPG